MNRAFTTHGNVRRPNKTLTLTLGAVTGNVATGAGGTTIAPSTSLTDVTGNTAAATPATTLNLF